MSKPYTVDGELAFPSEYIGAPDLKGRDVTVTIEDVEIAELKLVKGGKKRKVVIHFKGTEKKWVCNVTNAALIAGMYGTEMKGWCGKRITLYPTRTMFGKQEVDAVRVRESAPQPETK